MLDTEQACTTAMYERSICPTAEKCRMGDSRDMSDDAFVLVDAL